jgi:hypothetical protein
MKLSGAIDLGRSLRQVFGGKPGSEEQVREDCDRQTCTAEAILARFFGGAEAQRRELVLLADEVGLGKTYVALAVAVSLLDRIRQAQAPQGLPANQPVVLVLTPNNESLYNKWLREAEAFQRDCACEDGALSWLRVERPLANASGAGNIIHLTRAVREASRSRPVLLIARLGALGAALHDRETWRRRALACVFEACDIRRADRPWCCEQVLGSGAEDSVPELLDLRRSGVLWDDSGDHSADLHGAYRRALRDPHRLEQLATAMAEQNGAWFTELVDDLTRDALVGDWPQLPLVIIDEVHGLKNRHTQARRRVERHLGGRACLVLGLSATPFQLRHDELVSILELRSLVSLSRERAAGLEAAVTRLSEAMQAARDVGELFRSRWRSLRPRDQEPAHAAWRTLQDVGGDGRAGRLVGVRPPRVAHALEAAFSLEASNRRLQSELRPFVIRHRHPRGYRENFVGRAAAGAGRGTAAFAWAPGMEVKGNAELAHYLMMRAVALAKEEKGLPCLGSELTGSYRHLINTSAVWKRLAQAKNPLLPKYRAVLEGMLPVPAADREHRKVQATVRRALEFFSNGQKTLIFCVYTETAEALRDELGAAVAEHLRAARQRVFEGEAAFENFRRRFFNRREPLYALVQDHPLLARMRSGDVGVPARLRLGHRELREVASVLVARGESPEVEKPDRRLILAAVERIAILNWKERPEGREWLQRALAGCQEIEDRMAHPAWLGGREPLSRRSRAAGSGADPNGDVGDPEVEEENPNPRIDDRRRGPAVDGWVSRLCRGAVGDAVAPYFREDLLGRGDVRLPLLAEHHGALLAQLDVATRAVAGLVFRRILMAEEFLLRYLADVPLEESGRWADYLAARYTRLLEGHRVSLCDRVTAYLETLARARRNQSLLAGYHSAAENRNVVQLVQGGTANRDRYFLGFNTPYRPEILVSTSVGQEGIDLHRECRHVIHHDLCWNPASIEQRTGRVDRIGSKVERERAAAGGEAGPTLEVAVPYLAATYDERMFEELHRRAQLFEVTMGGDVQVEGRVEGRGGGDMDPVERDRRVREGIGSEDEDLGQESDTGAVDLPEGMVGRLRVDLSVWGPAGNGLGGVS